MSKKFVSDSPSFDEINALRKPRTEAVLIPIDPDILDDLADLEAELARAQRADARKGDSLADGENDSASEVAERLEALRAEAEKASAEFDFEALPRRIYRKLVVLHPSSDKSMRWDEERFVPALLAATCTQPVLSSVPRAEFLSRIEAAEKADDLLPFIGPAITLWNDWSPSQTDVLSGVAWKVNEGREKVPTGARSSNGTANSERNSTTAAPEESPTPSS